MAVLELKNLAKSLMDWNWDFSFCLPCFGDDEDINPDTGMATPTEPAQAPPGPLTRARARELNFVMILKNEGLEVS